MSERPQTLGNFGFQSRSGFSLRRDPASVLRSSSRRSRFQSRSGFSLRRDGMVTVTLTQPAVFQSRSGFSLRRDRPGTSACWIGWFQSRSGFSLRRDHFNTVTLPAGYYVSIPVWVFSPSRQACRGRTHGNSMFQSRSGFSLRRDTSMSILTVGAVSFQSRSGFSLRRDARTLQLGRDVC